tara:strand:+ start:804 stop:1070 length:267 start_codon:yes stop_codon:yes gene_type:complete
MLSQIPQIPVSLHSRECAVVVKLSVILRPVQFDGDSVAEEDREYFVAAEVVLCFVEGWVDVSKVTLLILAGVEIHDREEERGENETGS